MEQARAAIFQSSGKPRVDVASEERPAELKADPELFWELAGPHKLKLYNFIHKCLSFSEEADDVYQETLLRGLKYLHTYESSRSFGTWLYAIAHNEIRRHLKNMRRNNPLPLAEKLVIYDEGVDPDLVREIFRFAEGLKPKQREVFFLFYDSGLTIAEISRITGVRDGNVKFILNRARNILRERMGANHEEP